MFCRTILTWKGRIWESNKIKCFVAHSNTHTHLRVSLTKEKKWHEKKIYAIRQNSSHNYVMIVAINSTQDENATEIVFLGPRVRHITKFFRRTTVCMKWVHFIKKIYVFVGPVEAVYKRYRRIQNGGSSGKKKKIVPNCDAKQRKKTRFSAQFSLKQQHYSNF